MPHVKKIFVTFGSAPLTFIFEKSTHDNNALNSVHVFVPSHDGLPTTNEYILKVIFDLWLITIGNPYLFTNREISNINFEYNRNNFRVDAHNRKSCSMPMKLHGYRKEFSRFSDSESNPFRKIPSQ